MAEASGGLGLGLGLRERTRRAVRAELMTVAMDLFARKGYDATTIDEIAAAAGVSRSSFFRYFASKEDVVLDHLDALGESLAEALAQRPAGEDAWTALRRAFDVLLAYHARDPQGARGLRQMLDGNPALRARNLDKQCGWHDRLIPHIAARLGPAPAPDPADTGINARPEAVIGAALACLEAAKRAWMAAGCRAPLDKVLDDVMRTVRPGAF
ncbi:TetR/AcrR family transcriptional regulator [Frankia sp. Cr1]|uniref:TetR/AcrR family transcriptional regulator n=1 Tax=Frankia sp. Cr1 TaxID=3073931 RepID=UPI002AD39E55|nr:TetR family transcriptional regulator [Frankia sp. Cr1]